MFRVTIKEFQKIIEVQKGENLLSVFQREGILIDSYCGGVGSCGKCVVRVQGEVSLPNSLEEKHLGGRVKEGFRLACQVVILGDIICEVTPSLTESSFALIETQEAWKEDLPIQSIQMRVEKPLLREGISSVEMVEKNLSVPCDWETEALREVAHLVGTEFGVDLEVITNRKKIFWVESHRALPFLGVAFDIGTTTVACELLDLSRGISLTRAGALNRQVQLGADVITRLRAIQDNSQNLHKLQVLLQETMNELIVEVCGQMGVKPERIFAVTVAGNTIMSHLFLGVSPLTIGVSPYVPVFRKSLSVMAKEVGLDVHPQAEVYLLPSVAGYVGGDVIGGLSGFDLEIQNRNVLYVDIGTNGEIALVVQNKVWCCGTAAGPAFEGAQITHGIRATLGAIQAVEMENGIVKLYTIGDVAPRGICGTGLIDVLAGLLKEGLIGPTGRFREGDTQWKKYFLRNKSWAFVLSHDPLVIVTQEDISQLQLAKAAIQAGRKILLREAGLEEKDIGEVVLAGAFGSFINPESARRIGLIPSGIPSRTVGNASLFGAKRALLSERFREKTEKLAVDSRYVELSARPDFQDHFFESLTFAVEG
ncbi:MAG: ASKHA domain-containing protein [Candidatus Caldatribacteriaceae bacterium]